MQKVSFYRSTETKTLVKISRVNTPLSCVLVWKKRSIRDGFIFQTFYSVSRELSSWDRVFSIRKEFIIYNFSIEIFMCGWCPLKGLTYLNKPAAFSCRFVQLCVTFWSTTGTKRLNARITGRICSPKRLLDSTSKTT